MIEALSEYLSERTLVSDGIVVRNTPSGEFVLY